MSSSPSVSPGTLTEDRGPSLVAVTSVFLTLTILSASIRIFTRLRVVGWIGADDALILCAAAAAVAEAAGTIAATRYGLGRHIEEQLPEWRRPYAIADLVASLSYSMSAMFVKLSLLAFYLRLSPNGMFRKLTYAMMVVSASFGVSSVIAAGVQCVPVSMLWDSTQAGHCIDVNSFYFANAGIHIFTELLIYILPIHTLWKLHLPLRQKLGLCGLMGVGAMLIVISCYRIVTIRDLLASNDTTWNTVAPLMWYTIELNLAIFIACGPAFLSFFRRYLPMVFGGQTSRSRSKAYQHKEYKNKNSYPLRSVSQNGQHRTLSKNPGVKTTITSKDATFFDIENSSEERIMVSNAGIQKQVDVWIENEENEATKSKIGLGREDFP
ncbi:hypothetical protein G7Y89_g7705 [Cudoniella acicularis]|uniref:Rhodopsin domain-containing protein n=1 Tax=Cudoniella acicularis TaxID=354080 RepID=A0A8H4W4A7_9HELO|nr:hypothetical protein G7Y89_g7705 [Cudoniella acicularis]